MHNSNCKGVLAIDTASPLVGVAYYDSIRQESWQKRVIKGADSELTPVIAALLEKYEIQSVVVSTGPGAFTGLRVGVSMALGIAFSKKIPIIPLSSLFARSMLVHHCNALVLLDARKGRVYGQKFDTLGEVPEMLSEPMDVELEVLIPDDEFYTVGEGALVYRKQIEERGGVVISNADTSPVKRMAEYGHKFPNLGIPPQNIQMGYVRGPSVTPPKNLGVAVGKEKKQ
jgi:tRNA threonylcarbamoyl adenosine modification protein YeaZ